MRQESVQTSFGPLKQIDAGYSVLNSALVALRYPTGNGDETPWSSRSIPRNSMMLAGPHHRGQLPGAGTLDHATVRECALTVAVQKAACRGDEPPVVQYHTCVILPGVWSVRFLPEAAGERMQLTGQERAALRNAVEKLATLGPALPYPHQSDVRGAAGLRELRPRGGRSPWRAFYRRLGDEFIVAAVGPEAKSDPKGFSRAVRAATSRLAEEEDSR